MEPDLIVADEAVSALDVSVQAQVLELFEDLQKRLGFAMIFITHDLRVAAQVCDRIGVMQKGRLLELGPVRQSSMRPSTSIPPLVRFAARPRGPGGGTRHGATGMTSTDQHIARAGVAELARGSPGARSRPPR